MAKKRCPRPLNRLLMMRQKGSGPFFQDVGVACAKSVGNFVAPGMPGDSVRAIRGVVVSDTVVQITFSGCVTVTDPPSYCYLSLNGGSGWGTLSAVTKISDTVWQFSTVVPVLPGDDVLWKYDDGGIDSGIIEGCKEGEDIGFQQIPVANPLMLAGNYILLETGGSDVLLLEDDDGIDPIEGYQTEDAV